MSNISTQKKIRFASAVSLRCVHGSSRFPNPMDLEFQSQKRKHSLGWDDPKAVAGNARVTPTLKPHKK
jgi:hypothetical protein